MKDRILIAALLCLVLMAACDETIRADPQVAVSQMANQ